MRLATAFALIVSCAPTAGRPTIASEDAPREQMPSTPSVAEIAPSVDPSSLPDAIRPLAFMPGILTNAGGALLRRSELRAAGVSIAVTCGTSGSSTWTCIEIDDATRCFEVPGVAFRVSTPHADRDLDVEVSVGLFFEGAHIRVWLVGDALAAA
jgi:hypothetical protein